MTIIRRCGWQLTHPFFKTWRRKYVLKTGDAGAFNIHVNHIKCFFLTFSFFLPFLHVSSFSFSFSSPPFHYLNPRDQSFFLTGLHLKDINQLSFIVKILVFTLELPGRAKTRNSTNHKTARQQTREAQKKYKHGNGK